MTAETQPLRGPLRKRLSHLWTREVNDWYVEPEWCSERLFAMETFAGSVWDPAAGVGRIYRSALRAGLQAWASDLHFRGCWGVEHCDFMKLDTWNMKPVADSIVSNPPFGIAEEFVKRAIFLSRFKTVMLLPANWVQGDKRSKWLETTSLRRVLFITPRPSMPPGAVVMSGGKPGNGTADYAWFVWEHGYAGRPEIGWCRKITAPKYPW